LSVVSFHEQVLGAHSLVIRAQTATGVIRGYALLLEILQGFMSSPVLAFDAAASAVFQGLQAQRVRMGTMDMRIAAIALCHRLTLLTRNARDFGKVPGLITENWTI
jgi:tRNA(fMet)-specific endonuclease VapC